MGRTSADLGGRRQPVLSFFGKEREREREVFLLSWKDASRSTERRFHQEGRGRQPPIREPVRGDVPQRPRARGRRGIIRGLLLLPVQGLFHLGRNIRVRHVIRQFGIGRR